MNKRLAILFSLVGFVLLAIFLSQVYFLSNSDHEQDFDVKVAMAEQFEPRKEHQGCGITDPNSHQQQWSLDCHSTGISLQWNQIGHEYIWTRQEHGSNISWQWVGAGHIYNISRITHTIDDSRIWELDYHLWSTSNLWIVDGHNYNTSLVWIAQGHNYNTSLENSG